jgi:predicted SAM-dependent methyltransferase
MTQDGGSRRQFLMGGAATIAAVPLGVAATAGAKAGLERFHMDQHRRLISEYLRTHSVAKLQIGAGGVKGFSDWLNTDIEPAPCEAYLDATKPFPIPDQSLSYIFSEHLFEHLPYRDGLAMLRECRRTLKPGGRVRLATPNLLKILALFQTRTPEMETYLASKMEADYWPEHLPRTVSPQCMLLNYEMRSFGHQFLYDPASLHESLEKAGFQAVREFAPGESEDLQLRSIETRHAGKFHEMNDYETMVFEAAA